MKDRIIKGVKILISVLLMYLLIRQIDYEEFRSALADVSVDGILVIVLAYITSIMFNAIKWQVLLPRTEIFFLVGLSFRAQFYATVLPGQLFGEASKITAWSDRGEDIADVTASVVFDKITGIIGQILLGVIGVYASSKVKEIDNKWVFVLIIVAVFLGIYISTERNVSSFIREIIKCIGKISYRAEIKCSEFYDSWCLFSTKKTILFKSIAWGIVNQLLGIVSVWYLSSRMGLGVSLVEYCWIMSLMSVILLLPVSFAGIGLRDTSMASMLSMFGVPVGSSLVISISMLLAQIISAGIGGIYVLKSNLQKKA